MEILRSFALAVALDLALVPAFAQTPLLGRVHQPLPPSSGSTTDVELLDVDADGDIDVVITNYGARNQLLLNDGRCMYTDALDRIPAPSGSFDLAPIGLLRLEPASLWLVASGTFGASGAKSLRWELGPDPGGTGGAGFHGQGLVGWPMRLTNPETFTPR